MSVSGDTFTFPSTGIYRIDFFGTFMQIVLTPIFGQIFQQQQIIPLIQM